jgi:hypothetical protein
LSQVVTLRRHASNRTIAGATSATSAKDKFLSVGDKVQFIRSTKALYASSLLRERHGDFHDIQPNLLLCQTRREFELFTYCRMLQGVPNSPLVGRRMAWLVFDGRTNARRLIGAFGLASSPYSLASRDEYFGWKGDDAYARKRIGLQCILDMPMCVVDFPRFS